MHMTRKQFTTLALAAAAMSGAWAQGAYPNKTVTFVVPAAAGGTTDISGRMAAQALPLDQAPRALARLRAGEVEGALVLVP